MSKEFFLHFERKTLKYKPQKGHFGEIFRYVEVGSKVLKIAQHLHAVVFMYIKS
jgi:hypothetical protein